MTKWLINQEDITILNIQVSFNEIHEAKTDRIAKRNRQNHNHRFQQPLLMIDGKIGRSERTQYTCTTITT